jgi:hypothetical protein
MASCSIAILPDANIYPKEKKQLEKIPVFVITVPVEKLSEGELKCWMKASMHIYTNPPRPFPDTEDGSICDTQKLGKFNQFLFFDNTN